MGYFSLRDEGSIGGVADQQKETHASKRVTGTMRHYADKKHSETLNRSWGIQQGVCRGRKRHGRIRTGCRAWLRTLLAMGCASMLSTPAIGSEAQAGVHEDGRRYWRLDDRGFRVELVQLQPDQVRAFYIARGFTSEQAEPLARTCLMQLVIENGQPQGQAAIAVPLAQWRIATSEGLQPLRLKESWEPLWQRLNVAAPAQLAFQWALFPNEQAFHPGDRNWGMLSTGLAAGSRFDLILGWRQGGQTKTATVKALQCAADSAEGGS